MRKLSPFLALVLALIIVVPVYAARVWVARAPLPDPDGAGPETAGTFGACVDDAKRDQIVVAYGFNAGTNTDTRATRIYEIRADAWRIGPEAPAPARRFIAGAVHDGKLFCAGGGSDLGAFADVDRFDPSTNRWTKLAPLPGPRVGAAGVSQPRGFFVLGGSSGPGPCDSPTNTVLRFDDRTGAWVPAGTLIVPRSTAGAARIGRYIYLFGGCTEGGAGLDSVERFDTRAGTSIVLPVAMPGGGRNGPAAATRGGQIHVTGGRDDFGSDPQPNHIIFRPQAGQNTGTFAEGPQMPNHCVDVAEGRSAHGLVSHGGRLFAVAGSCSSVPTTLSNLDELVGQDRDGSHENRDRGDNDHEGDD
ncbi:MAG TPA: kelch repeat-containing protein [Chloroflexota bacterium]|nr:kelch repeat-containing protein [Chloroflexota bacterium]